MTDDLLVSYLLQEADDHKRRIVEEWITADKENLRYFENFQLIWNTSKEIEIPHLANAADAWQRFKQRTKKSASEKAVVKNISSYASLLRIAAAVIVCFGIATLLYFMKSEFSTKSVTFASVEAPKADTLPDGSMVTLNKHSQIRYASNFTLNRKLKLKGEAFFNVAHDKVHPFTIDVNDMKVTVVGTSFNIKTINGNTEVIVETGVVKVEKNGRFITLTRGEKLTVVAKSDSLSKTITPDHLYNYYRSHEFVCDNTPLWKLVEVLNEAYESNIVIENKSIGNLPLTTTFYDEPLEKILSVISETFNISVERSGNTIVLK
ncbi:MAG: FecR domain-containing protein [Flavitalea sp.]